MLTALSILFGVTVIAWMAHRVRRASRTVDKILREELDPPEDPAEPDPQRHGADHVA